MKVSAVRRTVMALTLLAASVYAAPSAPEDAETLIRRVIDQQQNQQERTREYAFRETTVKRDLESDGRVERVTSETFLVTPGPGGEYRRRVEKDGEPLSPDEEAKEEREFQKHLREQLRLSEEERTAETKEKLERRVKRYQQRLEEALEVFDFQPLPDEVLHGVRVRVFSFSPKPGYEGHSRATKVLARMEGAVWIDPERDQLAKLHLRLRETLKFLGGIFGRLSEGSEANAEAFWDGSAVWLLDRVDVSLDARLYFLKNYRQTITFDYHGYEKYTVSSKERVTPPGER